MAMHRVRCMATIPGRRASVYASLGNGSEHAFAGSCSVPERVARLMLYSLSSLRFCLRSSTMIVLLKPFSSELETFFPPVSLLCSAMQL